MLGKLFKYEFKAVNRMGLLLTIIAAGVTLLGIIYLISPLFTDITSASNGDGYGRATAVSVVGVLLGFVGLLSYAGMLIGLNVAFMIFLGIRFFRSMYSDEGYLTHTLPVKTRELFISKVVTGGIWMLIMNLVLYLSVAILIVVGLASASDVSFFEFLSSAVDYIKQMISMLKEYVGIDLTGTIVLTLISLIVGPFANVAVLFGALSLGMYSSKRKGLIGMLFYLAARVTIASVSAILNLGVNMWQLQRMKDGGYSSAMMLTSNRSIVSLLVTVVFAIVLTLWANHVVSNRLNLD